jgi:reductive dehalogenase
MTTTIERPAARAEEEFPIPYLGRTARIVAPVANQDPRDNPHARVSRGELGKALYNLRHSTMSPDPLVRVTNPGLSADVDNTLRGRAKAGGASAKKPVVADPKAMAAHIKSVAKWLGLDVVGTGKSHPTFMYSGKAMELGNASEQSLADPESVVREFPYFIVGSVAWDYDLTKAHRHHIGATAYECSAELTNLVLAALEGYIHELGYRTLRGGMNPQAGALASGMAELGRNGLIITPEYGARVHATDAIMTDLPMEPGQPVDFGVNDFCAFCRKCATTCPTNSITFDDKVIENGVEKYKINWETCYKLRPFTTQHWSVCLTCAVICPFTKPLKWWHRLAVGSLKTTPVSMRRPLVGFLKWLDDRWWGVVSQRRVRWMGYDSGIKPGEKACTIEGCTADHDGNGAFIPVGNIGYYAPLKEDTNRFVKR